MRRNISGVHTYGEFTALEKVIHWYIRDGNIGSRMLHALSVLLGPEDADVAVWATERLEAFVTLLAVV
jgi:hypothetical protein